MIFRRPVAPSESSELDVKTEKIDDVKVLCPQAWAHHLGGGDRFYICGWRSRTALDYANMTQKIDLITDKS